MWRSFTQPSALEVESQNRFVRADLRAWQAVARAMAHAATPLAPVLATCGGAAWRRPPRISLQLIRTTG